MRISQGNNSNNNSVPLNVRSPHSRNTEYIFDGMDTFSFSIFQTRPNFFSSWLNWVHHRANYQNAQKMKVSLRNVDIKICMKKQREAKKSESNTIWACAFIRAFVKHPIYYWMELKILKCQRFLFSSFQRKEWKPIAVVRIDWEIQYITITKEFYADTQTNWTSMPCHTAHRTHNVVSKGGM